MYFIMQTITYTELNEAIFIEKENLKDTFIRLKIADNF